MSIYRMWNFKCNKCNLEAVLLVYDETSCPKCKSIDVEYDEK